MAQVKRVATPTYDIVGLTLYELALLEQALMDAATGRFRLVTDQVDIVNRLLVKIHAAQYEGEVS